MGDSQISEQPNENEYKMPNKSRTKKKKRSRAYRMKKKAEAQDQQADTKVNDTPTYTLDLEKVNVPLCDIGANLMDRRFNKDRNEVIKRAEEQGITRIVMTGTTDMGNKSIARFLAMYKNTNGTPVELYGTCGVHPHYSKSIEENTFIWKTMEKIWKAAPQNGIVAIGETGLDYNRNLSKPEIQRKWFERHVEKAIEYNLPLFCHEREAFEDFIGCIDKVQKDKGKNVPPLVVHCFTGTGQEAVEYVKRGFYIGLTGCICKTQRGAEQRKILQNGIIPVDKIMIETDCPYMAPPKVAKHFFKRNEPCTLPKILETCAACCNMTPEKMAQQIWQNTKNFFSIE